MTSGSFYPPITRTAVNALFNFVPVPGQNWLMVHSGWLIVPPPLLFVEIVDYDPDWKKSGNPSFIKQILSLGR